MASWLSSKLKEAEQFLQQIDQQAAESLGKPEKPKSSSVPDGNEYALYGTARHSPDHEHRNRKDISKYTSETPPATISTFVKKLNNGSTKINNNNENHARKNTKKQAPVIHKSSEYLPNIQKDDWTELLASTNDISSPTSASSVGSSDSGHAAYEKFRKTKLKSHVAKNGQQNIPNKDFLRKDVLEQHYNSSLTPELKPYVRNVGPTEHISSRQLKDGIVKKNSELHLTESLRNADVLGHVISAPVERTSDVHALDMESMISEKMIESKELKASMQNAQEFFPEEKFLFERIKNERVPLLLPGTSVAQAAAANKEMKKEVQSRDITSTGDSEDAHEIPQTGSNDLVEQMRVMKVQEESPSEVVNENEINLVDENLNVEDRESIADAELGGSKAEYLESDADSYDSDSVTDSESNRDSDSEDEIERQKSAQKQRIARRKRLADMRAAAAQTAIDERKAHVENLEKEVAVLEHILAEREKQQEQETAELRLTVTELLQTLELEKKSHNTTRMKVMARESELENQNAEIAKCLGALQWELEEQVSQVSKIRDIVESKESFKAALESKLAKFCRDKNQSQQNSVSASNLKNEDYSFEEEQAHLWEKIQKCQIQVKDLEMKIHGLKHNQHAPTQTEIEFEAHLVQLTDHIIQKQAQVETLSTEKATLLIRLEALSTAIEEERVISSSKNKGATKSLNLDTYYDMEYGLKKHFDSKRKASSNDRSESASNVRRTVSTSLSPVLIQLDSILSIGISYLRRHKWAQGFVFVYILSLHLWVMFVLFMS